MENFKYKKSLGQNFLIDKTILDKIITSSDLTDEDLVLEVGAGSGTLTKELVKTNAQVISYEIDDRLKNTLNLITSPNLKIIFKDFLQEDLTSLLKNYKYKKLYVIANIPYYITTPIIEKVLEETDIYEMIIMVQKEVGNRLKAKPNNKEYGSLSVYLQYYFSISLVTDVPRECFNPSPNVDSVVIKFLKINKYKAKSEEFFFKLIKDAFHYKRKNLRNNFKEYDLSKMEKLLKDIKKDLTYRAEQLSIEDFLYLSDNY
ncbi:MAG: 16S rRNA (adenine(1518)-N(6)/adenine(1519)-N(6))-dimethyltransferase RsmA [Bacilli bacterium]